MMQAASPNDDAFDLNKKRPLSEDQRRSEDEDMNSGRDESHSPSPSKRLNDRDPEEVNSPEMAQPPRSDMPNKNPKTMGFSPSMDTDSPASYPKHVIVPSPPDSNEHRRHTMGQRSPGHYMDGSPLRNKPDNVVTPLRNDNRQFDHHRGYDGPAYRPAEHGGYNHHGGDRYNYNMPHGREMEPHGQGYGGGNRFPIQPKRWACDFCNVATFTSFEEAQAHEEVCAGRCGGAAHRQQRQYPPSPYGGGGGPPQFQGGGPQQREGGLGTLYQATQELRQYPGGHGGHRMPPQHHQNYDQYHHSPHAPLPYGPPPPPPQHQYGQGGWNGGYDHSINHERNRYPQIPPRFQDYNMYQNSGGHNMNRNAYMSNQKRMLLAMPTDADSLSDRQCFVRSDFVEVFEASDKDVSARHSKGAQKLAMGQVGIRCIHCAHLRPKDRAERAVCYPSSISRIYQTVADMQRFHFEQCREIPENTLKVYRSLKTTRPRGVGSPQTYWIQSAKLLSLIDSEEGIRFITAEEANAEEQS